MGERFWVSALGILCACGGAREIPGTQAAMDFTSAKGFWSAH
jgi:hypothetical protein